MSSLARRLCGLLLLSFPFVGHAQQRAALDPVDDASSGIAQPLPVQAAAAQPLPSTIATGTARLAGTVLDINGGVVPGATVTLVEAGGALVPGGGIVTLSDASGRFVFEKLPLGRLKYTITAPGLQSFVSTDVVLKPAEQRELPQLALPIASTTAEVQVTVTQAEIAQEEIHAEEKQRVLGVLPNFYSSYIWNAAPLIKRQKFSLGLHSILDPTEFLGAGVAAGIEYKAGTFDGYGYGVQGYFKRFGADYADGSITRMIGSAILPAVLHQDPRYFYKGSGTRKSRALYAISRAVITRGDDGRAEPNYSHIGGAFLGGAISNTYRPAGDRGVGLTVRNGFIDTAGNAAQNLIREFFLRAVTPSVPPYANGKP